MPGHTPNRSGHLTVQYLLSLDFQLVECSSAAINGEAGRGSVGLAHSSYNANGNVSGATLARFQVTGGRGSTPLCSIPESDHVNLRSPAREGLLLCKDY